MPARKKTDPTFKVADLALAKKRTYTRRKPAEPVQVVTVHPAIMTAARALSRNRDVHVVINRDGTVTVANGGK